jgi:serine acetyltransferase
VEHDNVIGDYVHISPRAALGGTVSVGACSHVGIGATVKNNVDICDNCVIGAGAVVVKNICEGGTYVGVPARKMM